jgi:glycerophosphoryl diester phosphodiesterase
VTVVIAHRGASRAYPENTIAAFRAAVALGADGVEFDVRGTADGHLAIHHDPRLPDGRALAHTLAADLPAGVTDLAAALDACSPTLVNLEIKNDPGEPGFDTGGAPADAVVALLHARAGRDRVLVSAFHLPTIDRVKVLDPGIPTAWLVVDVTDETLARLRASGHRVLHPHYRAVTQELLSTCHEAGITVNAWTLDEPAAMRRLSAWGLDGVCTNVPDVARRVLAAID